MIENKAPPVEGIRERELANSKYDEINIIRNQKEEVDNNNPTIYTKDRYINDKEYHYIIQPYIECTKHYYLLILILLKLKIIITTVLYTPRSHIIILHIFSCCSSIRISMSMQSFRITGQQYM